MTELRIVGTRTFAGEVADFARDAGLDVVALLEPEDLERVGTTIHELPVEPLEREGKAAAPGAAPVILATGEGDRREIVARVRAAGWRPVSLIHPRAHLAPSATVGEGSVIGPGAIVGAYAAIGANVVIGRGTLVGHHTRIDDLCTFGPGANVAGNTRVRQGVFIGMSAAVRDHVTVGERAVVAMGAVVVGDVEAGAQVRGVPARPAAHSPPIDTLRPR